MKKILQYIFSVKNEDFHKIWTVLGIKFKFKNKYNILIDKFSNIEKNDRFLLQIVKQSSLDLHKELNNIGNKVKKDFIINTIDSSDNFNMQQEIYNFYEEMKARKFYPIFRNRISINALKLKTESYKKRFGKNICFLSDMENIPKEFNVININDIEKYKENMIVLAYNKDYEALKAAETLRKLNIKYFSLLQAFPHARYFHTNKHAYETLLDESKNNNWHFCPVDFENIFQALENCKNLDGDFIEIGTFKGDSASATLNYMKRAGIKKQAYFFDTFVGFDYEDAYNSEDGYWQNTHKETSFTNVQERLAEYDNAIVVQKNIITDKLPNEIEKICVANIDVDMYEAVKAALYKVKDKIVKNGIIIAEDYGHTPSLLGAQKATREFLEENPNMFISVYLNSGQLFLIRK